MYSKYEKAAPCEGAAGEKKSENGGTDIAIIYVTHYPEEIQDCFDKCLLMQNGAVLANGTVDEIFNSDILSELLKSRVIVQKTEAGTISFRKEVLEHGLHS